MGKPIHSYSATFSAAEGANPNANTVYVGGGYDDTEGVGINIPAKTGYFPVLDYAMAIYKVNGTGIAHPQILLIDNGTNTLPLMGRTIASGDGMDSMVLEFSKGLVIGKDMTFNVNLAMAPPTGDSRVVFINASAAGTTASTAPLTISTVCRFSIGWHYEDARRVNNNL